MAEPTPNPTPNPTPPADPTPPTPATGDRWYATGDNDAINIYERQSDEWSAAR